MRAALVKLTITIEASRPLSDSVGSPGIQTRLAEQPKKENKKKKRETAVKRRVVKHKRTKI